MTKATHITHRFVDNAPDLLEEQTLYISIKYATALHKCCCGCGREVVTPFSPTDWMLTYDGETVSLDPSIGNWNYECRSHYWIDHDQVRWARQWSDREIRRNRARGQRSIRPDGWQRCDGPPPVEPRRRSLWHRIRKRTLDR
jgi:hypothetical protein